jgi:hypothetical protein|tara:strand:+ start:1376 stop:1696 length:321 start_codon:yes stop_codon:yes gene_type:complete
VADIIKLDDVYGKAVESLNRNYEDIYELTVFSFSWALEYLKDGEYVARSSWKNKYLMMHNLSIVQCIDFNNNDDNNIYDEYDLSWNSGQNDILANDWIIYKGEENE